MEKIGYSLGSLANLRDIANLDFFKVEGTEYTAKITNVGDSHSHSAWQSDDWDRTISFGTESLDGTKDYIRAGGLAKSTTYHPFKDYTNMTQSVSLNKYAVDAVNFLAKGTRYNVFSLNCTNMQSIAYWLSGIPAIGIHPYLLYASTSLYQSGIFRPDLYSFFLLH